MEDESDELNEDTPSEVDSLDNISVDGNSETTDENSSSEQKEPTKKQIVVASEEEFIKHLNSLSSAEINDVVKWESNWEKKISDADGNSEDLPESDFSLDDYKIRVEIFRELLKNIDKKSKSRNKEHNEELSNQKRNAVRRNQDLNNEIKRQQQALSSVFEEIVKLNIDFDRFNASRKVESQTKRKVTK